MFTLESWLLFVCSMQYAVGWNLQPIDRKGDNELVDGFEDHSDCK